MPKKGIVSVKWVPPEEVTTMIETQGVRVEMNEDEPDKVWIWILENGEKVEGGSFSMDEFMNHILNYYHGNY